MWGAAGYLNGSNPCNTCPQLTACKDAVHAGYPVTCEEDHTLKPKSDRTPRGKVPQRHYFDHITPGEAFTAADLAARTGATMHAAGTWISAQLKNGLITCTGNLPAQPGEHHHLKLFQLKESP